MITTERSEMRKTGVDVIGDLPWGTHFCLFYDTKADLLETLVWYFWAGLQSRELCLWVIAPPVTKDDALEALRQAIPESDRYILDASIEIVPARDVYLPDGTFNLDRTIAGWIATLQRASARGYAGVRLAADTAWLEKKDWKDFCEYEDSVNGAIANQCFTALCTYPLAACGAGEILDVVRTHQFAVTKRRGSWDIIETAGLKKAKAEIKRLNEELEQRVIERTSQLASLNVELRNEVRERERAEEALRWTEAYLVDGQRLAHAGSWAWKTATRDVIHWSAECFRLYGFDPERGTPTWQQWSRRVHPDDLDKWQQAVENSIRQRSDYELDYRIVLPTGTIRHIHSVAHPIFSPSGDLEEFVGTSIDVTEQRRAEDERRRLQTVEAQLAHINRVSMMGELAASLAHEFKQPLAAVITSANACLRWLERDSPDLERARAAAMRIEQDGTRASEVINRLRSFYRKEAPDQRELVDVNQIILEMAALLRDEATRYSVAILPQLGDGMPRVIADRVQLQQVLMNLMLNAIDAMKDTVGELTIRSGMAENAQVLVSVSDTGIGLPPKAADRIFDAFFTTKPQGTGMGLAITRSLVESHGGRVWASANAGPGATFHFTLPTSGAGAPA